MSKVSFIGDGKTKTFYFTFPFFTKDDIVIEINSKPATNFGLFCTTTGLNADIPFSGGKVTFNKAPKPADTITIYRKLTLNRTVDYQPTAQISPTALNQDMNFMIEILKDMQKNLSEFGDKYCEIVDKESTAVLLDKINTAMSVLDTTMSEISAMGDISAIQSSIDSLNNSLVSLNSALETSNANISNLHVFKDEVSDYVIEMQTPTPANNFTWFRKYKSGWLEQGGVIQGDNTLQTIALPVPFASGTYSVTIGNTSSNTEARARNASGISSQDDKSFTSFTPTGDWKWWEARGASN